MENTIPAIIVVLICRFKTSIFFAPYWVPIKIEAPIHIPFTNKIASVINGLLVPTAANASFSHKLTDDNAVH